MERLFVYGTLGPGRPNEHVMQKIGGAWQAARVKGKLIKAGWGSGVRHFPPIFAPFPKLPPAPARV